MHINAVLLVAFSLAAAPHSVRALPLSLFNAPVTEDFDSLVASGASTALPDGWSLLKVGSASGTYTAGTGTSSIGNFYSFGATGSSERAFGMVRSGSAATAIGTLVANQTGATIADLAIAYTGEQWRLGASGRFDRLDFAYSLDATSLASGQWVDVDLLDFVAPKGAAGEAVGSLDGNSTGNRVLLSYQLSGLSLAPGGSLLLRWSDSDATGADDGLAIDDFSITAVPLISPPSVAESLPPGISALTLAGVVMVLDSWRRRRAGAAPR